MSTHGGTSTSAPPATTVTGPDAIGAPAVVGTGLHYARNDHDHGLPILDYNALQYSDLLGWSYDPGMVNSVGAVDAATDIELARIPLPAQLVVTNVMIYFAIAGLTLTNSFLALFKSDGTVIGQSADQSTAWGAGGSRGLKILALAGGPYTCTPLAANDFLWAAWYVGTATTMPQFCYVIPSYADTFMGTIASRTRTGYIAQANTPTLGSIIPANISPHSQEFWFGI
jgi:hypothetical protein